MSDRLEEKTGTDPLQRDTDSDSVPDGLEDLDQDGRLDPGETDPRRPGLFPGAPPHIPEPLAFDLVRGLGARRGELEVNTLVLVDVRRGEVAWAPEVEWAFATGHAVELELPMLDRHLEAVKVAVQGTLPSPWAAFTHGWQVFAEVGLDAAETDGVLVYVWGQRFARRWSYLSMLGANTLMTKDGVETPSALGNLSLFVDVREWQTWGIEANATVGPSGDAGVRVLPQLHVQATERVRFQWGAGAVFDRDGVAPVLGLRGIVE